MVRTHLSQVIILSGILASQTVLGGSVLKSRDLLSHILTRQVTCEDTCNNITSIVKSCGGSQACLCNTSNADLLESCVDCVVAFDPTENEMGQATLNDFNSICQGTSVASLTVDTSSPGATSPLQTVSMTSRTLPDVPSVTTSLTDAPSTTTSASRISQVVVTTLPTSSSAAGSTPLHHAPGLVVVGFIVSVVLVLG